MILMLSGCKETWHYELNISDSLEKLIASGEKPKLSEDEGGFEYNFSDFKDTEMVLKVQTPTEETGEDNTNEESESETETEESYEEHAITNELKLCKGVIFNLNTKLASIYDTTGSTLNESSIFDDRSAKESAVVKFRFNDDNTNIWAYVRSDGALVSRPWESYAIPMEYYDVYPVSIIPISEHDYSGEYRQATIAELDSAGNPVTKVLNDTIVSKKGANGAILTLHLYKVTNNAEDENIIPRELIERTFAQFQFTNEDIVLEEDLVEETVEETTVEQEA